MCVSHIQGPSHYRCNNCTIFGNRLCINIHIRTSTESGVVTVCCQVVSQGRSVEPVAVGEMGCHVQGSQCASHAHWPLSRCHSPIEIYGWILVKPFSYFEWGPLHRQSHRPSHTLAGGCSWSPGWDHYQWKGQSGFYSAMGMDSGEHSSSAVAFYLLS